jgi:hypothetical protein
MRRHLCPALPRRCPRQVLPGPADDQPHLLGSEPTHELVKVAEARSRQRLPLSFSLQADTRAPAFIIG